SAGAFSLTPQLVGTPYDLEGPLSFGDRLLAGQARSALEARSAAARGPGDCVPAPLADCPRPLARLTVPGRSGAPAASVVPGAPRRRLDCPCSFGDSSAVSPHGRW